MGIRGSVFAFYSLQAERKIAMRLVTFKGGVHPPDGKHWAKDVPIKPVLPKGDLAFLLSQHIGAPAKPLVAAGDRVLKGQKIAEAGGFVSSPVFSSVSGTVKGIEKRFNAIGTRGDAIIVENDGQYEEVDYPEVRPIDEMTKEEIIKTIADAGVVGMGGAGFPTHVKLSPKEPDKIEYIIANCAECEPYITTDYRRMLENPEKLIAGLKVVLKLFDNAKGILAVENNKRDCIEKLEELTRNMQRIEVVALKTKYPQGAERSLIYATTGRTINSTMLPADAGCIVDNVETLIAIDNAVNNGRPVTERSMTVTGRAIKNPGNFLVPIGMNQSELIEICGGFKEEPEKIISGGPMMGFALFTTDIPTTKTSSCLLCRVHDIISERPASACINCGRCVDVCPSFLVPSYLADFAEHRQAGEFEKWHGLECVECGCCSYTCPAKRPLKQDIASYKKDVMAIIRERKAKEAKQAEEAAAKKEGGADK